jgi:hypothetical protein
MIDWAEKDDLLEDGYPTEEVLAALPYFTGTPAEFFDILETLFGPGGIATAEEVQDPWGRQTMKVDLVTGGWSGCESVIGVLERCHFGYWWQSSSRGGLHIYEVPSDHWHTPMGDWPHFPTAYERLELVQAALDDLKARIDDIREEFSCQCNKATCSDHQAAYLLDTLLRDHEKNHGGLNCRECGARIVYWKNGGTIAVCSGDSDHDAADPRDPAA